ncbi:MAG: YihY/virulence factor BrkB family protein [Nitrospirota bacterium]
MPPRLTAPLRHAYRLLIMYVKDGGPNLAAAISFYAIISFIPLLFIFINILAYFLGRHADLQSAALRYVQELYPVAGTAIRREIALIISKRVGWISFIAFIWAAVIMFNSINYAINKIFKTLRHRAYLLGMLTSFVMILAAGVFFTVSFWLAYIPKFLDAHPNIITQSGVVRFLTHSVLLQAAPLLFTFLAFTMIYKFLPRRKISMAQAAAGGMIAGLLWEASKYVFAWYIGNIANLSLYGSLAAAIIFMLWIYYSANILLLVAELMYIAVHRKFS